MTDSTIHKNYKSQIGVKKKKKKQFFDKYDSRKFTSVNMNKKPLADLNSRSAVYEPDTLTIELL